MNRQSAARVTMPWFVASFLTSIVPVAAAQSATVIRCGAVIDGRADRPVPNAAIVVTGDKITAVGTNVTVPPGAREVDLRAMTCLPGLIDLH
ncbi:MAG: hypothetical protein ACKVZ0_18265, partial [Gemmatimonadales bacterium]